MTRDKIIELLQNVNKPTSFEDVSSEPVYVADQIIKLVVEEIKQVITLPENMGADYWKLKEDIDKFIKSLTQNITNKEVE